MQRPLHPIAFVSILALVAVPAAASTWSIGTNLGFSVLHPHSSPSEDVYYVNMPASSGISSSAMMAGLRLGWLSSGTRHEFYLDGGASYQHVQEQWQSGILTTLNYQLNLGAADASFRPYLTGGGGWVHQDVKETYSYFIYPYGFYTNTARSTGDRAVVGAGVGLRHAVAHGYGAIRGEVRFDYLAQGNGDLGGWWADVYAVKLGFDVLLK